MNLKDFFSINLDDSSKCFFHGYQMFSCTDKQVDYYRLAENKEDKRSQLTYEVYSPGSDTGEAMLVDQGRSSGFIVQGELNVIINSQVETLEAGDGFIVEPGHPYRLRNISDAKAILVINRSP
jgi:mannose-6-phosphate isomerase-like protein (cupin superfamily)